MTKRIKHREIEQPLSIIEVANLLMCSERKVAYLIAEKKLESFKVGSRRAILPSSVSNYISSQING